MRNNKKCSSIIKVFFSALMVKEKKKKTHKIKYLFPHVSYAHTKYFGFLISGSATLTPCLGHCLASEFHHFKHKVIQDPHCYPIYNYGLGLKNKYLPSTECSRQFSISENKTVLSPHSILIFLEQVN